MKLWLDDLRPKPSGYDAHAKTAEECIDIIEKNNVIVLSLDHDLGTKATGYDVACHIEKNAHRIKPMMIQIHSANQGGAKRMKLAIKNAYKAWGLPGEPNIVDYFSMLVHRMDSFGISV